MSHYTESFNRLVMNIRITLLLISFVALNFLFLSISQNLRAALTSRPCVLHFSYYCFSKYSTGTVFVSHTPLTDK